jgi:hypothetical protein
MDPTGFVLFLAGWVIAAIGATTGLALFFKAAHCKEHALPEDDTRLSEWIRARVNRSKPPRAAA